MDHIHQAWEWWYNGGRVSFVAGPYVFCVVFLYSRTEKEARLRFSNTALQKWAHGRHYTTTPTLGEYGPLFICTREFAGASLSQ